MMKKLQKIIRARINVSKMSDIKIIQGLKKFERIEKRFERLSWKVLTVRERSMWKNDSFCRTIFYFLRLNSSVVGLFIGFLTSGWILAIFARENFGCLLGVFLVLLLFIRWLGGIFRLNDHVHFVLKANLIFLPEGFWGLSWDNFVDLCSAW